eukprot:3934780-Rhodomonas_salina.6
MQRQYHDAMAGIALQKYNRSAMRCTREKYSGMRRYQRGVLRYGICGTERAYETMLCAVLSEYRMLCDVQYGASVWCYRMRGTERAYVGGTRQARGGRTRAAHYQEDYQERLSF